MKSELFQGTLKHLEIWQCFMALGSACMFVHERQSVLKHAKTYQDLAVFQARVRGYVFEYEIRGGLKVHKTT